MWQLYLSILYFRLNFCWWSFLIRIWLGARLIDCFANYYHVPPKEAQWVLFEFVCKKSLSAWDIFKTNYREKTVIVLAHFPLGLSALCLSVRSSVAASSLQGVDRLGYCEVFMAWSKDYGPMIWIMVEKFRGRGQKWEESKMGVVHSEHYFKCHESFNVFLYWKMRLGSLPSKSSLFREVCPLKQIYGKVIKIKGEYQKCAFPPGKNNSIYWATKWWIIFEKKLKGRTKNLTSKIPVKFEIKKVAKKHTKLQLK